MSEIISALLRGESPEDIAKRRLDILLSHDLFGLGFNAEKQLNVIDTTRANRMTLVSTAKMLLRRGFKEHWIAKILFVNDFLGPLSYVEPHSEFLSNLTKRIASATAIDYSSVLASPMAYSILFNLNPFTLTQMVIAVDGTTGVGKTSLVYSSVKAVLHALGLSERDANELFLAMYVQRMDDFIELMKLVESRDLRLPVIVYDDVAVTASAYLWFSSSRKKLIEFAKLLTISRERIANLLLVGPYSAIFKGLRRLAHMVFSPTTRYERLPNGKRVVVSLWYVYMQSRTVDLTGTVAPYPLKVDDTVYTLINKVKEKVRQETIENVSKTVEEEQKEQEEEGVPEEVAENVNQEP
ncbi:MAG: hypothetical protein JHC33_13220 [Ignisphaera sp.]|nr:hypothetical protein [Ignisphaera sp.]